VGIPDNRADAADRIHLKLGQQNGKRVDPVKAGVSPDFPQDVRSVVTFKAVGDNRTEMTVTEYGYTIDQWFDVSNAGLEHCLDKRGVAKV
jgi:hypothetical protein